MKRLNEEMVPSSLVRRFVFFICDNRFFFFHFIVKFEVILMKDLKHVETDEMNAVFSIFY